MVQSLGSPVSHGAVTSCEPERRRFGNTVGGLSVPGARFTVAVLMCGLLVLSSGCTADGGASKSESTQDTHAYWNALAARFTEEYFEAHPTSAVYAGRHEFDGRLPNLSRSTFERRAEALKTWRAEFEGVAEVLPQDLEFERQLLFFAIDRELYVIEREQKPFKNIAYYRGLFSPDVYLTRSYAPLATRMAAVTSYARNVPAALRQMQQNLSGMMPRSYAELAQSFLGGMATFLADEVQPQFAEVRDVGAQRALKRALDEGAAAFRQAEVWADAAAAKATDEASAYALGKDLYADMLRSTEVLDVSLEELERWGVADLQRNQRLLANACAEFAPGLSPIDCVAKAAVHKAPGGAVTGALNQLAELEQFVVDHNIASIPTDARATVDLAPVYRRSNFAYIHIPGPFESTHINSVYYVAPPDPSWTAAQQAAYEPSEAQLLFVSAHEVWPGHFLHYQHINTHPRLASRVFRAYATTEGWAHYVEQVMWEAGLREDPASQIGHLIGLLTRNARYLCSIRMHTQGMTVAEAKQFFIDQAYTSEGRAIRQAARGAYDPQYLKYTLGKLLLERLRDRWEQQQGGRDLRAYHDAVLGYAGAPLPLTERFLLD